MTRTELLALSRDDLIERCETLDTLLGDAQQELEDIHAETTERLKNAPTRYYPDEHDSADRRMREMEDAVADGRTP